MQRLTLAALFTFAVSASAQDQLRVLPTDFESPKMLHAFLLGEAKKHFDARREAIAALKTPDDIRKRQEHLKQKFIEALGGFPEKTPLNAKVVGTLKANGFRVERVIYESRPHHHVTANFYIPDGTGPFPGVLLPCGHGDTGKAAEAYQKAAILMAQNGFAVLCYDPIGQGERNQLLDKTGKPAIKGTTEHTMVGLGALLIGQSTATYRIWDGIRSLDYLVSRPEVDAKRLGCTGNSGGGTLTAYLMALDDRIVCAAPSCYITSLERLFATIGPQDAEQNITGQVAFGIEHADYVTMRAPQPTLICTATQDFFDIKGSKISFQEAKEIYGKLGAAERVDFFEYDDKHGFSKPRREAAMRWMRRWLLNKDDAPSEGDIVHFKDADLQCTRSGQVLEDFQGRSVIHFNLETGRRLGKNRDDWRNDPGMGTSAFRKLVAIRESLDAIRKLLGLPEQFPKWSIGPQKHELFTGKSRKWKDFEVSTTILVTEPGVQVPVVSFGNKNTSDKCVIYLDENGLAAAATSSAVGKMITERRRVIAADLRGWGETAPAKAPGKKPGYFGVDFKESFLGIHVNRPLLGQRVFDLLRIVDFLAGHTKDIEIVAVGATGPVALHAAVLDERIKSLTLERSLISWMSVVETPISYNQLTNIVPGALKSYDLPDLAARLAGRPLTIRQPVDAAGRPVSQQQLDEAYAHCRASYERCGAGRALILTAAP